MIANYFGTKVPTYGVQDEASADSKFPALSISSSSKNKTCAMAKTAIRPLRFMPKLTYKKPSVFTASQLQGKSSLYNNIADFDAALECVSVLPNRLVSS